MKISKANKTTVFLIPIILGLIGAAIYDYVMLPAWNFRYAQMWAFVGTFLFFVGIAEIFILTVGAQTIDSVSYILRSKRIRACKIIVAVMVAPIVLYFLISIPSMTIFRAKDYASLLHVEEANFDSFMKNKEDVKNIALMDSSTAHIFGERALGELSYVVSQYDVAPSYTQININGEPQKVAPLVYDGFFKWLRNQKSGIPGYINVDPAEMTAKFVKLEKGYMKYTPSDMFSRDADRALRKACKTAIFGNKYMEISDKGVPYYVAPILKPTIGAFGGLLVEQAAFLNMIDGTVDVMPAEKVPSWADTIYDGHYICNLYNYKGMYSKGFLNSIFGKEGVKRTTGTIDDDGDVSADYGYLAIDDDIWTYTGITSVSSDASNIAVIAANARTGEVKEFSVAGADETSAMNAAEGEVQQYGYQASFPSLINVNGAPTYVMVLTDKHGIVKNYALVNMENYTKVVVADTSEETFNEYEKLMGFTPTAKTDDKENLGQEDTGKKKAEKTASNKGKEVTITVSDITYIVTGGETVVYITADDGAVYKADFEEEWLFVKTGDEITKKLIAVEP